jgi:hypothetical protein
MMDILMMDNILLQVSSILFLGVMLKYRTIEMLLTKNQDENTYHLIQKLNAVIRYIAISTTAFLAFQIAFSVLLGF